MSLFDDIKTDFGKNNYLIRNFVRKNFRHLVKNLKVTISSGVIITYHLIIGLSHENRLSKYVMLFGNVVYTVL